MDAIEKAAASSLNSLLVFEIALAIYGFSRVTGPVFQDHALQAKAWLMGHFYVDHLAYAIHERIWWRGHWYIVHPPLSAVVMVPFAALGLGQLIPALAIGATAVLLAYRLTKSYWLTAFFGFGTPFWYQVTQGDSWAFPLILGCLLTVAALLATKRDFSLLAGIFAGLASLARYDLMMAWPLYLVLLERPRWSYFLGLGAAVSLYILNAYLRFGTLWDISLWEWYRHDAPSLGLSIADGPFNLKYLGMGVFTALFMAPNPWPLFPYFAPSHFGQSLLTSSPGLLLTLRASLLEWRTWILWGTVAATMAGCLTVWSNGTAQLFDRYWIVALPFLLMLMTAKPLDQLAKILILASIMVNIYGIWWVRSGNPF